MGVQIITDVLDEAREAVRLADGDPRQSIVLAADVTRRARRQHDFATAAVAERAFGVAAQYLQDLGTAARHLRRSVDLGLRAQSAQLVGEAQMSLAFVLNELGQPRQAMQEIELALARLDGVPRVRAEAQRAAILQRQGHLEEAIAAYRSVLPVLRRAEDKRWEWRVRLNRGVAYAYRYELSAAEQDLEKAITLARELRLCLAVAAVHENLGFVSALRGDVPAALRYLRLAERRFRRLGVQRSGILTDRSELHLSVYLAAEALELGEQALGELVRERRQFTRPEVRLLLARSAMLDGDPARARTEGERAAREFTRQQRRGWAELARHSVLTARLASPHHRSRVPLLEVERAAEALEAVGWPGAALEARIQAGQLAVERGQVERGQRQLRRASRARRGGPAILRARAWYAEGMLRLTAGRGRGAATAARTGLRVLDEHRATLGATDLRAHVSAHRIDLAQLGLQVALAQGRPRRVLAWAERGRASHLLLTPVHPPADRDLARALAELRLTVEEIKAARRTGLPNPRLVQRLLRLETQIRDHTRLYGNAPSDPSGPQCLDDLSEALGEAAMVEFVHLDGTLHALTVTGGRVHLHRLGRLAPVERQVRWLQFALHRLAHSQAPPASQDAAVELLHDSAEQLDAALLRPLAGRLRDRDLVLVPTGPLQSVPWSLLPSCVGRPISVTPSASLWRRASDRPTSSGGHTIIAAGPDLPGARAEVEEVAGMYAGSTVLVESAATVESVLRGLDRADLAHLAAHGTVRADNPLFSSLQLVNGPLTLYDVERLERTPRTVVLAACDGAKAIVRPGDEVLGFSATFLARDTRQLIASVVPIPDAPTAPLMIAFHRLLAAGRPAAAALAQAQQRAAGEDAAAMAAAAGFVCIGAGLRSSPDTTAPPRLGAER